MDLSASLSVILRDWSSGRGPLYQRLASAIREAVRRGDVAPGARLPSERDLAGALAVSRTTVVAAYGLLRDEGVLERTRGSGTRVAPSREWREPAVTGTAMPSLKLEPELAGGVVDCSASVVSDLAGLGADVFGVDPDDARDLISDYTYEYFGLPPLRAAIADLYSAGGLPTTEDEVLVTSGAQQAIHLLFSVFGRDGGTLLVENPTYVGALDAARDAGARVVGVPIDAGGIQVRAFRDALERSSPRLAYVMAGSHNPTGVVMSPVRRREIIRLTQEAQTPLVEDRTLADLTFGEPTKLSEAPEESTVITVGSMSKLFWAGLRIGWIRAPASLVGRLARVKLVQDLGTSHVSQLIASRLLPRTEEVSAVRRMQLLERLDVLAGLLEEHLPRWSWSRPSGGPFLWVRLPFGDAEAFSHVALRHGVRVLPGRRMSPDEAFPDHLRISYVADPQGLRLAVERLRAAWDAFASSRVGRLVPEVVV